MIVRLFRWAILVSLVLTAKCVFATTYYIAANGSDANNGASKSSPWAHLPGMATCVLNCAAYAPLAGDTLIMRGCDVWPNASFPINWAWSGESGNVITIGGEDQTWYNTANCPSGWNKPIFDAGGVAIKGTYNVMLQLGGYNYITVDNIEMRGLYWNNSPSSWYLIGYITANGSDYITLNHLYIHRWTHGTAANDLYCVAVWGDNSSPYNMHSVFENGVIQNSTADGGSGDSCYAFYLWGSVENSVMHDLVNGVVKGQGTGPLQISGNLIYNIVTTFAGSGGLHCNAIETAYFGGTAYIHDNVIHDMQCPGGESMMLGNNGETDYVWNNIIYNLGPIGNSAQTPSIPQESGQSGITARFWNNTIVSSDSQSCINANAYGIPPGSNITVENTHCIQGLSGGVVTDFTAVSPNLVQTLAQANATGYNSSQTYAYFPTSVSSPTVGYGANLTSSWPSGYSTNDTSYACSQQTVNGVVQSVCPARTPSARSSAGVWDVGAYQFSSLQVQAPQPPTNLHLTVQAQ
jgi:hypothetical protein